MGWSNIGGWQQGGWGKPVVASGPIFPSLPGMLEYWEADSGITGSNITAWAGKLGNYTLTNSGIVPFNSSSAYNSKPAADFTTGNSAALSVSSFGLGTGGDISVFVVGRVNTGTPSYGGIVSYGSGGGNDFNTNGTFTFSRDDVNAGIAETDAYTGTLPGAMTIGVNHRFGFVCDFTNLTKTLYVDNTQVAQATSVAILALVNGGTLVIGNRYTAGLPTGGALDGPILGVYISNAAFNSTNRSDLDTYLTTKWGT